MYLQTIFYKKHYAFIGCLLLLFLLSGCEKHVYIPTDIKYESVSPAYVLQIHNQTGHSIIIEPNNIWEDEKIESKIISDGEVFDVIIQLIHYKVDSEDVIGSNMIVSRPYIDQAGSNTAVIRIRHSELYELNIDLESEDWFSSVENRQLYTPKLKLNLTSFLKSRWFFNNLNAP